MAVKAGDRVTYAVVTLRQTYRGTVVAVGETKHGGDCMVQWDGRMVPTEEDSSELVELK